MGRALSEETSLPLPKNTFFCHMSKALGKFKASSKEISDSTALFVSIHICKILIIFDPHSKSMRSSKQILSPSFTDDENCGLSNLTIIIKWISGESSRWLWVLLQVDFTDEEEEFNRDPK